MYNKNKLMNRHKHIQNESKINVIIVNDDYLCYKEPENPYNFFLNLIFNELFKFKTSNEWQHWKTGSFTPKCYLRSYCLRSHTNPFPFSTVLPRLWDQKISM